MRNTIKKGDWWHNVAIKTSVVLADFNTQMLRHRSSGGNPNKFVYNAPASLKFIRNNQDAIV